ncbi:hypothetical protein ACFFIY_08515 [Bhargavaea ullalensis]|uniref:Uncharacterized protein n=1 Tax=Bhargavaea ullalensis TaxID=1265685 RepID=A0ABV2GA14_9BACL
MDDERVEDKELAEWLRSVPKPEDGRNREDVLARLKKDPRLNKKKRLAGKWIPAGVAAAALLTFGALFASMTGGWNHAKNDSAKEDTAVMTRESTDDAAPADFSRAMDAENGEDSQSQDAAETAQMFSGAVYPQDAEGYTPFTIGLSDQAAAIPVTLLIPDEKVKEDFGGAVPGKVDLYNRYSEEIGEQSLGFDDYHPYKGTVSQKGGDLVINLAPGHPYDGSGGAVKLLQSSLIETFSGFDRILLEDEEGNPADFDQVGKTEPIFPESRKDVPFYAFEKTDGTTVLAPDLEQEAEDPAEAMFLMKSRSNDLYSPVIPEDSDFTVELPERGDTLTVRFDRPFDFATMSPAEAARMIDGMALTAAGSGLRIRFVNAANAPAGYDLSGPLPLPLGPNGVTANLRP